MNKNLIREGDLYEEIEIYGKRFEIRYGYYEDFERDRIEPVPVYPLFYEKPEYSPDGFPLAMKMQEPCSEYVLQKGKTDNEECGDCIHFQNEHNGKIGICKCEKRRIKIEWSVQK